MLGVRIAEHFAIEPRRMRATGDTRGEARCRCSRDTRAGLDRDARIATARSSANSRVGIRAVRARFVTLCFNIRGAGDAFSGAGKSSRRRRGRAPK